MNNNNNNNQINANDNNKFISKSHHLITGRIRFY